MFSDAQIAPIRARVSEELVLILSESELVMPSSIDFALTDEVTSDLAESVIAIAVEDLYKIRETLGITGHLAAINGDVAVQKSALRVIVRTKLERLRVVSVPA